MKLNNKGWGVTEMLALVGILFFFFLLAILLIVSFYRGLDQTRSHNKVDNYDYSLLERNLENAANRYLDDKFSNFDDIDTVKTSMDKLIDYGYFSNVGHEDCDGYVISTMKYEIIDSKAYISCDNYATTGYNRSNQ